VGDELLNNIGITIKKSVRKMDLASRYGGEEMAIIMPNADLDLGCQIAERIRNSIEKLPFDRFSVTVSIGLSERNQFVNMPEKLIAAADDALYEAKRMGKNKVRKAPPAVNKS
jgi:diguanylate cyclase (GGDEF)-like protein